MLLFERCRVAGPGWSFLRPISSARFFSSGAADYYTVLCIKPTATLSDVKRAFREQAKIYHPDVAQSIGNEAVTLAKFKLVNEAYSVLGDDDLRRQYDRENMPRKRRAGATMQERNEGVYAGVSPVDAAAAAAAGDEDAEKEAFRNAMLRAAEKHKEGQRARGSLARMQRAKVEVIEPGFGKMIVIAPAFLLALWAIGGLLG